MSLSNLGLTDAPLTNIQDESLGLGDYVKALNQFINTCQTPMTIAIQGDWGSGKTSMMNVVREGLDPQKTISRWFNTWQFAQFHMQDDIAISLLSGFLDELGDDAQKARSAVKNLSRMALKGIGNFSKAALEISTGGGGDLIKDYLDKLSEGNASNSKQLSNLKEEISNAVSNVLKKQNAERMVVFIDDLDRLVPERAVEILEVIKLFLDIDQCVFVLAVDYNVVSKGLQQKFGMGSDDLKGRSFFDKIIQLPFSLPIAQYDIRKYMKTLCIGALSFEDENIETLVVLAENSIGTNPRSLKRLFNALQLLYIVANNKSMLQEDHIAMQEERKRILFAVLCLQLSYEPVYSWLFKHQQEFSTELFDTLATLEKIEASPDLLAVAHKSILGGKSNEEGLHRFTRFMGAFKDALQLNSDKDDENFETLNTYELNLVKQFLTLSALTSAHGGNPSTTSYNGKFRFEQEISRYVETELKPQFESLLSPMGMTLSTRYSDSYAQVRFNFEVGAFAFDLSMTWSNDRGLRSAIWQVDDADKYLVKEWFNKNISGSLPKLRFQHLRCLDYGILDEVPLEELSKKTESEQLAEFKNLQVRVLSAVLPALSKVYHRNMPVVTQINTWLANFESGLKNIFKQEDGWIVENDCQRLKRFSVVKIRRHEWDAHLHLALEFESSFLRGLYIGVKRKAWRGEFGSDADTLFTYCKEQVFPEQKNARSHTHGDWFIYANTIAEYRSVTQGSIILDNLEIHPEAEQISTTLLDKLGRFSPMKSMLDDLVRHASINAQIKEIA